MWTTEEIQYTVGKTIQANNAASLRFEQPNLGLVKVDIEKSGWYSMIKTEFELKNKALQIELKKSVPFVCMFFQLKGGTQFSKQTPKVPEQHHSLNYLPYFESQYVLDKHIHLRDVSIKINPETLSAQLQEEGTYAESWQKIMDSKEPYVTLHCSEKMNPVIWDTLYQLLHCPYTGAVGQMYKDLLVRMLFIHQLMTFTKSRDKSLPQADGKLHKRDIEVLHAIKNYLEHHYLDDLSLDTIVKEFGINTFKLKYGFKKLFGTSVMRFIDDKKMAYAKQLLLDNHTEVMDIAERLGYNHYNNFSAAFKRKFGFSPASFTEKPSYVIQP